MKWSCSRVHVRLKPWGYGLEESGPRECRTFGGWLLCQVSHRKASGKLEHQRLRAWLARRGFIDAPEPWGVLSWRWDFWRSELKQRTKELA